MIEILKIGLPALLVFLTAYLLIDKLLRNDENRRNFEYQKKMFQSLLLFVYALMSD